MLSNRVYSVILISTTVSQIHVSFKKQLFQYHLIGFYRKILNKICVFVLRNEEKMHADDPDAYSKH